jgi:hypothetical protein
MEAAREVRTTQIDALLQALHTSTVSFPSFASQTDIEVIPLLGYWCCIDEGNKNKSGSIHPSNWKATWFRI